MKRDRKYLKNLAQEIHAELERQHLGSPFRLAPKIATRATNTDGWAATLGSFVGRQTTAEVWIDRFTGHRTRKVYYALTASRSTGIAELAKAARNDLGPHLSIYLRSLTSGMPYTQLQKRLAKSRFGHPVYERYKANDEYFYGVYELDRTGLQRNEFKRLVERVVDFFQTINGAVASRLPKDKRKRHWAGQGTDDYPCVENRQSVVRHLRRERKGHVATMRKQHDNYVCQVCEFDFFKTYGGLGDDFAEAHHLVPLSANQRVRQTTIEDLVTVCANCHRMLHRMRGVRSDVGNLRRILQMRRRRQR